MSSYVRKAFEALVKLRHGPKEAVEAKISNNYKVQTCRLATAGLLAVLGMLYPRSYMAFLGLMFLDIFSHWSEPRAL